MEPFAIFVFVGGLIAIARIIAGLSDGQRIEAYAAAQGWRLLDRQWAPFGPGWYGSQGPRIYKIRYVDAHGDERTAFLKTSLSSGVYLTKSRILRAAPSADPASARTVADLKREIQALQQQIRELEGGAGPS